MSEIPHQLSDDEVQRLNTYLLKKRLQVRSYLGKGFSSRILLVQDGKGTKYALKIERSDSPRPGTLKREAEHLKLANSAGIGPKLYDFDPGCRAVLMEYIEGEPLNQWLLAPQRKASEVLQLLQNLFGQAEKLDALGLDHGQLAGTGRNILVRDNRPVIIDFEKASTQRKPHNRSVLAGMLIYNPHSVMAKRVRELLRDHVKKLAESERQR
jgi:putative serine/threonine protein kinase